MPSINMIAARRAEKHKLEQKTKNIVYSILAEGGLFLVVLSFMIVQLVATQGQAGELKVKIAKLKAQVDRIQALQKQTAQLQPELTALDSARDNTLYWYTAIENCTSSLSNTTWLANLATNGDPSGVAPAGASPFAAPSTAQMLISGMSLNQADVGLTMLRMNQYPQFDRVTLNFVQQQSGPAGSHSAVNPVQFQMAIQLHPTAPPKDNSKKPGDANVQKS